MDLLSSDRRRSLEEAINLLQTDSAFQFGTQPTEEHSSGSALQVARDAVGASSLNLAVVLKTTSHHAAGIQRANIHAP